MYYSKTSPSRHGERITVPQNYSGNAFRVKDESERRRYDGALSSAEEAPLTDATPQEIPMMQEEPISPAEEEETSAPPTHNPTPEKDRAEPASVSHSQGGGLLSSILQGTSLEDIILIALTFMMLQDETNDDVLLLLIILLFLK